MPLLVVFSSARFRYACWRGLSPQVAIITLSSTMLPTPIANTITKIGGQCSGSSLMHS